MSTTLASVDQNPQYSYDEVQYPSHAYEASHPDQLYTLAKLFRMSPALPDTASILELGCASGGNIIPIAMRLPNSRCVGVDLSAKQIGEGVTTCESLGLKNIRLVAEDFCNIDESYGQFDYILCHGVFSWVPRQAQERIFEICRDRLSPQGVAYISYNAYPGWFMRGMIREMMLHHISQITDPITKVKQARALLAFLVTSTEGQDTPYAKFLKQELDMLSKHSDAYLFHDHLEENNHPMFFYQFMDMARSFGLQFLSESNLASMITSNLPPKAAEALTNLTNDIYQRSQYTDFVTNRMFRQSLLCRRDCKINRHIEVDSIAGAHFSGRFQAEDPAHDQDVNPTLEVSFKCPNGRKIKTNHPAVKAMMYTLQAAWPTALPVAEICRRIEKRLAESIVVGASESFSILNIVQAQLMQMMVRGDVDLRLLPDRFNEEITERPHTTAYTREQAKRSPLVTTLKHGSVQLDPLSRLLIQFIDGNHTQEQMADVLMKLADEGKVNINVQGGAKPENMRPIHQAAIAKVLEQLRRACLLT